MAEYLYCSCTGALHGPGCTERELTEGWENPVYCKACGAQGAHFCTGEKRIIDTTEAKKRMNEILAQASAPECKKHKRYQAKRKPRVPCEGCWRKYIYLNPG